MPGASSACPSWRLARRPAGQSGNALLRDSLHRLVDRDVDDAVRRSIQPTLFSCAHLLGEKLRHVRGRIRLRAAGPGTAATARNRRSVTPRVQPHHQQCAEQQCRQRSEQTARGQIREGDVLASWRAGAQNGSAMASAATGAHVPRAAERQAPPRSPRSPASPAMSTQPSAPCARGQHQPPGAHDLHHDQQCRGRRQDVRASAAPAAAPARRTAAEMAERHQACHDAPAARRRSTIPTASCGRSDCQTIRNWTKSR